jgi:hypothetical protein
MLDNHIIDTNLKDNIQQVNISKLDLGDEHGPQSIEEDLENGKENLTKDVGEKLSLVLCWKIGIQILIT